MAASVQTIIALVLVAIAAALLARAWLGKRKHPGCGGGCGAVSPASKQLRARLKK